MGFSRQLLSFSLGVATLGCGSAANPPVTLGRDQDQPHGGFSAERAWSDLEAIAALGPRPAGGEAARAARAYLVAQLEAAGLSPRERVTETDIPGVDALVLTHLSVTLPGKSSDRFVLLARYDSDRFEEFANPGVNGGASGAALLLEVARVAATRRLFYALEIVFVEGDGRLGRGEAPVSERRGLGSELLAQAMRDAGELRNVRLLIAFDSVCDADLEIARDLGSQRHHREQFWRVAGEMGHDDTFVRDAQFQSVDAGHRAFAAQGLRAVLAVVDTAYGGSEPPGFYANTEEDVLDHCAPESLSAVGSVTLRALDSIGARLAKIDRFSSAPGDAAAEAPATEPVPETAETTAEPEPGPEDAR